MRRIKKILRLFWNQLSNLIWTKTNGNVNGKFILYQEDAIFKDYPIKVQNEKIVNSLSDYNKRNYVEYIYEYKGDIIIEPIYGWGLLSNNEYLSWSLPYHYYTNPPDIRDYLQIKFKSNEIKEYDAIISFRDVGEGNYFHLYDDIISKFSILKNYKEVLKIAPVLIARNVYEQKIFKEIIRHFNFEGFTFLPQNNEYIKAKRAIFCKTFPLQKKYYNYLETINFNTITENNNNKTFLIRNKTAQRTIKNYDEIFKISEQYGFILADTNDMTLSEQIKLFNNIKYLIGIHGAGLVNMIYCKHNLKFLEIFPPNNIPPHYYWLAKNWGFEYNAIAGEGDGIIEKLPITNKIDFYVNPRIFENAIKNLLL